MIYDTFLYDGEFEMLALRLKTLRGVVDKHIAVCGYRTFRGDEKGYPLVSLDDRLIYAFLPLPKFANPWQSEAWHRDFTITKMPFLEPEDIVLVGDVDEIPDPEYITHAGTHMMDFYSYSPQFRKPGYWPGTVGIRGEDILSGKITPSIAREKKYDYELVISGWHLSYFFMTPEQIARKIKSFSHSEYDRPEFTDLNQIQYCMETGRDLFGREGQDCLQIVEPSSYLPAALKANPVAP